MQDWTRWVSAFTGFTSARRTATASGASLTRKSCSTSQQIQTRTALTIPYRISWPQNTALCRGMGPYIPLLSPLPSIHRGRKPHGPVRAVPRDRRSCPATRGWFRFDASRGLVEIVVRIRSHAHRSGAMPGRDPCATQMMSAVDTDKKGEVRPTH